MRRCGFQLQPYPAPHTLAWHLREIITQRQVDLVVDVGAHHGGYAQLVRETVGYRGALVSIEPASAAYARVRERFGSDPQWHGLRVALGSAAGQATLNLYDKTVQNSLHLGSSFGTARFAELGAPAGAEAVAVERLDEILPPWDPSSVLLKVDTQGHDLQVLAGSSGILHLVPAVQIEVQTEPTYEAGADYLEVLAALHAQTYDLLGLWPVTRRRRGGLALLTMDALFVRRDADLDDPRGYKDRPDR